VSILDRDHLTLAAKTHQRPSLLSALLPVPLLICLLVGLVALPRGVVYAASITVNTTDDELNADGDCSLREAIVAANTNTAVDGCPAGSGADTIVLPAGTYVLTIAGTDEDAASTGDLDITQSLTIDGADESTTIVDGNATDRVFELDPDGMGSVAVSFSSLTITNGDAGADRGGGIFNHGATLTLDNCVLSANTAESGGGLVNSGGTSTLTRCIISGNSSTGNDDEWSGRGAGIDNSYFGTLRLNDSRVIENTASGSGGGVFSYGPFSASHTIINDNSAAAQGGGICAWSGDTLALDQVQLDGNSATEGGGIRSFGTLNITNSDITYNAATGDGGGILHAASLNLTDSTVGHNSAANGGGIFDDGNAALTGSTIRDNIASDSGGGVLVDTGARADIADTSVWSNSANWGGGVYTRGALTVSDSSVTNNGASGDGGGIYAQDGAATLTDSTISGNSAATGGGGGIELWAASLTVNRCTLSGNSADIGGGIDVRVWATANLTNSTLSGNSARRGGGVYAEKPTRFNNCTVTLNTATEHSGGICEASLWGDSVYLHSTIVAGNTAPTGPNCYAFDGGITSQGYNLYGDESCTPAHTTDLSNTDPLLGALQDNGGPTLTHALARTSLAVDAADNTNCPATDQRGQARPVEANGDDPVAVCDIGAFELAEANLVLAKVDDPDPVLPGQELAYGVVVVNTGPDTARDLVVTETMPPGMDFTINAPDWLCTVPEPSVVRCDLPDLVWGQISSAEFLVPIPPDFMVGSQQTVTISNTATLATGMLLDDPADNFATTETTIEQGRADLRVTKTREPQGTIWGGHPFTYTILIENDGPSVAENVQFSENLTSAGLAFGSMISAPNYTCNPSVGDPVSGTDLHWDCTRNGLMYPQEQDEITVVVTVEGGGAVRNSVAVSTNTLDLNPINNMATTMMEVTEEADLEVAKFSDPQETGSAYVPFTYTVQLTNHGPSGARDVVILDTLASDSTTTASIVSAPGYTCDPGVGVALSGKELQWACTRDAYMYFDVHDEITIVATGEGSGDVNNVVEATTASPDPEPSNNSAEDSISLIDLADLQVVKMSKPDDTVLAGEQFEWYIFVQNNGPSPARNVHLTDNMLSDGQFSVLDFTYGPEYDCTLTASSGGYDLNCSRTTALPPGAQDEMIIEVVSGETCDVNNQVWITTGTPDPDTSNNQSLDSISVFEEADLQVTKISEPDDAVLAGDLFSWYIFVQNNGPSPARNVRLTDTMLSDGQFFLMDLTYGPEYDCTSSVASGGYQINCSRTEALPAGVQDEIIIQALSAETCDINNQVWVTTASPDPDASSNYAQDSIHVGDTADLALTKAATGEVQVSGQQGSTFDLTQPSIPFPQSPNYGASPTEVTAGRRIQYTLTVDNAGPSTAHNVQVTDRLPAGVTLYPGSLSVSQGSCETGTPGVPIDEMVCGLGALEVGQSATITFQVLVGRAVRGETVLENDASVSSDVLDLDNSDNHVHTLTMVNNWADLLVSGYSAWGETAVPLEGIALVYQEYGDQVTAGRQLRYEITVENRGPGEASGVTVDHWVEYAANPMMTFLRADGASCSPDEVNWGLMHCQLGTLAAGATQTINLYFLVFPGVPPSVPFLHSEVDVFSSLTSDPFFDAHLQNDTWVIPVADLSVRKSADAWKVYAGEQIRYDISVTNRGPSWAWYVTTVTDTLPAGVEFEVATLTPEQCVDQGSNLVCTWRWWDPIPNGETRTFSVFARVRPDTPPGTISNEALVACTHSWDPLAYNDRDTAASLIGGKADLKIQKFGKPDGQVYAGEELTYTIIVDNLGPGYAHDVLLTDLLESSGIFELISVTSDRDADCSPTSGLFTKELQLTCSLTHTLEVATTQPGSGRWMLTVVVQASEAQDINNVAKVASSDYDPDLSNNEAMAEHEITSVADLALTKSVHGEVLVACDGETELWHNQVAAGAAMTYTLTISNTGPSTANNVVLTDQPLPSLLEITEVTPSKGACDTTLIGAPDYALECWLGTLLPGQTETVLITADVPSWVPAATTFTNVARVYSDMFDDDNSSNMGVNDTIVSALSDLEVLKTQDPEIALPGWDVTYSITVTNLGPSDAEGVFISDTIPVQLLDAQWTCCASGDGQCDVACEPPVCPNGPCEWPDPGLFAQADIPAGEWVIYTVEGTLDWWPCGPFTNTVEVVAPQSLVRPEKDIDPCDENNIDIAVNDPMCHFDPLVLKAFPGPDSTD